MTQRRAQQSGLSDDELREQSAEEMPDREAMSLLDTSVLDTSLLNLDVDLSLDADVAAPIDAAVAANANVAAPINASVGANVLTSGSTAISSAEQDSVIVQTLDGVATADATQDATIEQ